MIFEFRQGLLRVVWEPQFCLETTSPLLTVQASDFPTLDALGLDGIGDMRLNPGDTLFPYSFQAYPEQLGGALPKSKINFAELLVKHDFSPPPRAFRWIRWFDQEPNREFGDRLCRYMVGHCLPEEVNETKWLHCLSEDKFYAFPLSHIPKDFDDIWICEDDGIDLE